MNCRHCNKELKKVFADLGFAPISNDMLVRADLSKFEPYYPLKAFVCDSCFLVQIDQFKRNEEIFNDHYTYFSSYSNFWLDHTKNYVDMMMKRFKFSKDSNIIELASNDGCLLQNFLKYEVNVLGIEPTRNTAAEAEKLGVKTLVDFFSSQLALVELKSKGFLADLIIGNNVLAHVPDINDFVLGMKIGLKNDGIITMEFPHFLNLLRDFQFDTIYHEHYSYLSLTTVQKIFEKQGLTIFDVEEVPTHGGSLRIFAKHDYCEVHELSKNVSYILELEASEGIDKMDSYSDFQSHIDRIKNEALKFLIEKNQEGSKIVGYGAASKGNTFINYCGMKRNDLIKFVCDASEAKQNKFLPGSHIPVYDESKLKEFRPDYVVILPWNIKHEVMDQLSYIREWGGKFITFIPSLKEY